MADRSIQTLQMVTYIRTYHFHYRYKRLLHVTTVVWSMQKSVGQETHQQMR